MRTMMDDLEEAAARLQKTLRDMALYGAGTDPAAADALLDMSEALTLLAATLARSGARVVPPAAGAKAAAAGKALRLAAKGARSDPSGFIANLKFCTIYSDLEKAAGAVENCVSLPAREA